MIKSDPFRTYLQTELVRRIQKNPGELENLVHSDQEGGTEESKFHSLSDDAFAAISDWYHYALLELITLKSFQPKPQWIASSLGISISEARLAVERLERLGLLDTSNGRSWRQEKPHNTNATGEIRDIAHRRFQRQVLEMALLALEEVPIESRDQSSLTVALNSKRLPEAISKISQFRRELCSFLERDTLRDQVYQLGISFYPLTHIRKERSTK